MEAKNFAWRMMMYLWDIVRGVFKWPHASSFLIYFSQKNWHKFLLISFIWAHMIFIIPQHFFKNLLLVSFSSLKLKSTILILVQKLTIVCYLNSGQLVILVVVVVVVISLWKLTFFYVHNSYHFIYIFLFSWWYFFYCWHFI